MTAFSDDFDSALEAAHLERDHAKHVQRLEVVGLAPQRRIVVSLRLGKPALLMASKALTELSRARRSVEVVIPTFVIVASGQFSLPLFFVQLALIGKCLRSSPDCHGTAAAFLCSQFRASHRGVQGLSCEMRVR